MPDYSDYACIGGKGGGAQGSEILIGTSLSKFVVTWTAACHFTPYSKIF